jgi:hypothetical protein
LLADLGRLTWAGPPRKPRQVSTGGLTVTPDGTHGIWLDYEIG